MFHKIDQQGIKLYFLSNFVVAKKTKKIEYV